MFLPLQRDNKCRLATECPPTNCTRPGENPVEQPSGNCVEVAALPDGAVAVRNFRHPSGPALVYTRAEIAAFLAGVRHGEFHKADDRGVAR